MVSEGSGQQLSEIGGQSKKTPRQTALKSGGGI